MNIGEKIKNLRVQNGLTQEELATRAELTKGFISQVERDIASLSIATLVDVLECLGTNLQEFFSEEHDEKIVFSKEDYFVSNNSEDGIEITWLVPNSQKNDMEPIMLTLPVGTKTEIDDAHPGEEFGYVMQGTIIVQLGEKKFKAKKGESFYYKTNNLHSLENIGKSQAVILWIATPPNF